MLIALETMIDRLQSDLDLDRATATALASVSIDLRVTQVVNKTLGVHAVLPGDRLRHAGQPVAITQRSESA
jgi:acetamidase/formamidase